MIGVFLKKEHELAQRLEDLAENNRKLAAGSNVFVC
jgi:hypothetical protein